MVIQKKNCFNPLCKQNWCIRLFFFEMHVDKMMEIYKFCFAKFAIDFFSVWCSLFLLQYQYKSINEFVK